MLGNGASWMTRIWQAVIFLVGCAVVLALAVGAIAAVVTGMGLGADPSLAADRPAKTGYAHVSPPAAGQTKPVFDRSREVIDVTRVFSNTRTLYCFDLTFRAKVAVGSAFLFNNATVATATGSDPGVSSCPEGYRDAVATTYAANTSANLNDVSFKIVFH